MKRLSLCALLVACGGENSPTTPPEDLVLAPGTNFSVRGRWDEPLELTYEIDATNGALSADEFERAVESALDLWRATEAVAFTRAAEGRVPSFTLGWSFQRGQTTNDGIAQAGPVRAGSSCALDPAVAWGGDGHDPVAALVHEVGHLLGLDHVLDPSSVMHPVATRKRRELGAFDHAAIHSLYGGGGAPAAGDVIVLRENGETATILRGVAPEGSELLVTDLDGDGADELLVWTTDPKYYGATRIYRFGPGPVLARTEGPLFAMVGQGDVFADESLEGERVLVTDYGAGRYRLCVLDGRGRPVASALLPPVQLVSGAIDADGDGVFETLPELAAPPVPPPAIGFVQLRAGDLDGDLRREWVALPAN